jgi:hypothetical protein
VGEWSKVVDVCVCVCMPGTGIGVGEGWKVVDECVFVCVCVCVCVCAWYGEILHPRWPECLYSGEGQGVCVRECVCILTYVILSTISYFYYIRYCI